MKQLDFKSVQVVNEKVQAIDPAEISNIPVVCHQTIVWCATQRAFIGEQQAIAKKEWMDKKKQTYLSFELSNEANKAKIDKYGVSVIKDYIAAQCGDFEARHEYCVRTNAALDSMVSAITMVISSMKEEMRQQNFGQRA
jgi:hypothetical protein